jgi:hypothetical protein
MPKWTEKQILEYLVGNLYPRYRPHELLRELARAIRHDRDLIHDLYGIENAPRDLMRLAKKWEKLDPWGGER